MKFIVSSAQLKSKLQPLFKCVNANTVLPILEDIYMRVENKTLHIESTDLENIVMTSLDIEYKDNGGVCIPAVKLRAAVNCDDQPLTFEVDKNFTVTIIGHDFKIKLAGENPDYWPKRPPMDDPERPITAHATYDSKDIMPILSASLLFASTDDLRPAMTGVYLHNRGDNKDLWIIATDAHRLYYKSLPLPETMKDVKMIIPKKAIHLLKEIKKVEQIKIEQDGLHVRFTAGDYTIISRHIDARYPDYVAVIPKEVPFSFKLMRKEAKAFINIAKEFANASTNQMVLNVDPVNQRMELTTQDVDFSFEFSCSLRAYDMRMDDPLQIAFNARFILQNLDQSKDDYVVIEHCGSPTRAVIMDGHILTMPLMLNN